MVMVLTEDVVLEASKKDTGSVPQLSPLKGLGHVPIMASLLSEGLLMLHVMATVDRPLHVNTLLDESRTTSATLSLGSPPQLFSVNTGEKTNEHFKTKNNIS
jgi:hypothetical protein